MSAQTGGRQPARRLLPYIPLIDRYIAMRTLRPFALSLGVVLAALLLERVLRLFDLLALKGGPYSVVIELAASLVPYYLGLALPAAFSFRYSLPSPAWAMTTSSMRFSRAAGRSPV